MQEKRMQRHQVRERKNAKERNVQKELEEKKEGKIRKLI